MKLFDVVDNLSGSKNYIYGDEGVESALVPYMINAAMSNFYDCIMHANEINIRPDLSKRMVYDYYHFAIQPKKKRFAKWASPKKDELVLMASQYYECSPKIAEQYLAMMTEEQIAEMRRMSDTGGRK